MSVEEVNLGIESIVKNWGEFDRVSYIEAKFLSMCILEDGLIDLIRIKPEYMFYPDHRELLKGIIICYNIDGYVDVSKIALYDSKLLDVMADVISEDFIAINDKEKDFMDAQKFILENYKTFAIDDLREKRKKRKITNDKFKAEVKKIEELEITEEATILTLNEIEENINTEITEIHLNKFPILDKILKLVQGDFLIIGARTGSGKSGLLLNIMNDLMDKYQCIYFNMEMSKSTLYNRMIAIRSNIPMEHVKRPLSEYQKNIKEEKIKEILNRRVIVCHEVSSLEEIKNTVIKTKNENKHTIVFLDHIGLIRVERSKSIYEQATEIAKQLRQFCLKYDCTIIAASQLNRTSYAADELDISMLKDSGEIENSASKVMLLYKDKSTTPKKEYEENMILEVVKNRDGFTGIVDLTYQKDKQVFTENVVWGG